MSKYTEVELKLVAKNSATLAAIRADDKVVAAVVPGTEYPARLFHAVYYDTPDLQLNQLKWSLRSRKEGDQWKAALKMGSKIKNGVSSCTEYEAMISGWFDSIADVPDGDLREALLQGVDEAAILLPRVEVKMTRYQRNIRVKDTVLEMVTDEGTISANGKSVSLCEVEFELRQGDLSVVAVLASELSEKYGLTPSVITKHQTGLSLYS